MILRGETAAVTAFARSGMAQTGVRHGKLHLIPVDVEAPKLRRGAHVHLHPHT